MKIRLVEVTSPSEVFSIGVSLKHNVHFSGVWIIFWAWALQIGEWRDGHE